LGRWVDVQRTNYKKGNLRQSRIDLLNQIDFLWNPHEIKWNLRYQEAVQYFKQNGHLNIPRNHPILGPWIREQRNQYRKVNIPKSRIELLEQIGMVWSITDSRWQEGYELLRNFVELNGHADVTQSKTDRLGVWVQVQRREYKKQTMSDDKIQMLDELGFIWSKKDSSDDNFMKKYRALLDYAVKNSDLSLIRSADESLYAWIHSQRGLYKKKKMPLDRIELLEKIPGWKWSR